MLFSIICFIQCIICQSIWIGTVGRARFTSIDQWNKNTTWLDHQISPQHCLCTVLSKYKNAVLHFNSYSNGSCQLFFSLPYTYKMEYNINSTIIFLSPLPPVNQVPCCSNLTWLMRRLQNSTLPTVSISSPSYLVIDDLDYLAVLSSTSSLYRYNRTTMGYISLTPLFGSNKALSYYNQQYFITQGSGSFSLLQIYSTAIVTSTTSISIPNDPRDYVFIRNGSVMVVAIQSSATIAFYNKISSFSYSLSSSLSAPGTPNTLYRVNDGLLYMATATINSPIYTLTYNSTTNSWTWGSMLSTKSSSTTKNFQSTMDACGRLWISVNNYGILIYDTFGVNLLYNWTISNGLNSIVLSKKFELYAADNTNGQILSYLPGINQCTS